MHKFMTIFLSNHKNYSDHFFCPYNAKQTPSHIEPYFYGKERIIKFKPVLLHKLKKKQYNRNRTVFIYYDFYDSQARNDEKKQ